MSDRDPSGEQNAKTPEQEQDEPDPFELLTELVEKLGPNGVNALHSIALAERDLRNASTVNPGLVHALDRADQLMQVRFVIEELLNQAKEATGSETSGDVLTHALGEVAITEVKRG